MTTEEIRAFCDDVALPGSLLYDPPGESGDGECRITKMSGLPYYYIEEANL